MKTSKPILIFQHSEGSPLGTTQDWLKLQQRPYEIFFWGRDQNPKPIDQYSGLIVLGGPQNTDQEKEFPWLALEKKYLKTVLENKVKVLGLCLGGQLLAEALGAKVGPCENWEVGWFDIKFKETGSPLVSKFPKTLKVMQYHKYGFEIPDSCQHFASGNISPNQAFIFGDFAIGLQFHPEASLEWAKYLAYDDEDPMPVGPYVQKPEELVGGCSNLENLRTWYFEILDRMF